MTERKADHVTGAVKILQLSGHHLRFMFSTYCIKVELVEMKRLASCRSLWTDLYLQQFDFALLHHTTALLELWFLLIIYSVVSPNDVV